MTSTTGMKKFAGALAMTMAVCWFFITSQAIAGGSVPPIQKAKAKITSPRVGGGIGDTITTFKWDLPKSDFKLKGFEMKILDMTGKELYSAELNKDSRELSINTDDVNLLDNDGVLVVLSTLFHKENAVSDLRVLGTVNPAQIISPDHHIKRHESVINTVQCEHLDDTIVLSDAEDFVFPGKPDMPMSPLNYCIGVHSDMGSEGLPDVAIRCHTDLRKEFWLLERLPEDFHKTSKRLHVTAWTVYDNYLIFKDSVTYKVEGCK